MAQHFEDIQSLSTEYEIQKDGDTITILRLLKEQKVMKIPEKIGGYPVTRIAEEDGQS